MIVIVVPTVCRIVIEVCEALLQTSWSQNSVTCFHNALIDMECECQFSNAFAAINVEQQQIRHPQNKGSYKKE